MTPQLQSHPGIEDKIDVVDWACGEVSTKLMDQHRNNPRCQPADVTVRGLLKTIGYERVTYGFRKHETGIWMFTSAPVGPINRMMFKAMSKSYYDSMDRMKKEGKSEEEMN